MHGPADKGLIFALCFAAYLRLPCRGDQQEPARHVPNAPLESPVTHARGNGTPFETVALLLQGGGALGAYQAGVYEALAERDIEPGWIAGISIGAINSAIIAGNAPEKRVGQLRRFWEGVSGRSTAWAPWLATLGLSHLAVDPHLRGAINQMAAAQVLMQGAPGFFTPRMIPPFFQPDGMAESTSWYDTSHLRSTLESLVDFDRINARQTRFSVGAVNVRTGNFKYFDNAQCDIRPEHIVASGALPPVFRRSRLMANSIGTGAWCRTRRSIGCCHRTRDWTRWCFRSICGARAAISPAIWPAWPRA
jgi:predicted acylesterase/phospholipase RssA